MCKMYVFNSLPAWTPVSHSVNQYISDLPAQAASLSTVCESPVSGLSGSHMLSDQQLSNSSALSTEMFH